MNFWQSNLSKSIIAKERFIEMNTSSFINFINHKFAIVILCWLWSLVFDFRRWRMRWWKYFRQSRMKADRFWSEIGISQFLLDLLQFRFPMLWGTEPIPFGTRAIQIWTRSIPVSLPEMRKWNQGRNRRMRRRKPSAITNILFNRIPKIKQQKQVFLWLWTRQNLFTNFGRYQCISNEEFEW